MDNSLRDMPRFPPLQLDYFRAGSLSRTVNKWVHKKTTPFTILAQPTHGHYIVVFGGRETLIKQGEVLLVPANTSVEFHHCDGRMGTMTSRWVTFRFSVFGSMDFLSFYDLPVRLPERAAKEAIRHIQSAARLGKLSATDPERMFGEYDLATRILRVLVSTGNWKTEAWPDQQAWRRLVPVFRYVRENLTSAITIESLTEVAALSPARLHAVFREEFQVSPMEYVRRMRLDLAARLLASTGATLTEIGTRVGIDDPFYLSRSFKKRFGISPKEYRVRAAIYR